MGTGLFVSRSDGDFPYLLETPLGSGHVTEQRRTNAGQVVVGGIERLSVEKPWGRVTALLFADARRLGVPGTAEQPTLHPTLFTRPVRRRPRGRRPHRAEGALRFQGWARRESSVLDDPLAELDPTHASITRSLVQAAGSPRAGAGGLAIRSPSASSSTGAGSASSPDASHGISASAPASRLAGGVGADLEWRATPSLTVSATARADARRDDATGSTGLDGRPLGIAGDLAPTGHLGASYRFAAAAVVSAHVGALSRPPSFQELYGNGASLFANPKLAPEHAFSADAGVHGDVGDARRLAFAYEVVGFVSDASNLIVFSPIGRGTFRAVNVDRALLGGAEVSTTLIFRGLRAQATYTLLLTEDLGADPFTHGKPLPGRPEHDLAADALYRYGPASLRYGIDVVAGVLVGSEGFVLPPRALQGLGLALEVPGVPGLRASFDVANLFDVRTLTVPSPAQGHVLLPASDFLGFPLPGRTFWRPCAFPARSPRGEAWYAGARHARPRTLARPRRAPRGRLLGPGAGAAASARDGGARQRRPRPAHQGRRAAPQRAEAVAERGPTAWPALRLNGKDGETFDVAVSCPEGFLSPSKPITVILKRLADDKKPEYDVACRPPSARWWSPSAPTGAPTCPCSTSAARWRAPTAPARRTSSSSSSPTSPSTWCWHPGERAAAPAEPLRELRGQGAGRGLRLRPALRAREEEGWPGRPAGAGQDRRQVGAPAIQGMDTR